MSKLPAAQLAALRWLVERSGDGCFDRHGVAFAQGETAPHTRKTWNALSALGFIQFYGGAKTGGSGYGRLRVTDAGRDAAK